MTSEFKTYRTSRYKCDPARIMRGIAVSWLFGKWWLVVLPLLALVAASAADTRFIYVSLVFIFIVFPMALSVVWLKYGLSQEVLKLSSPQIMTVDSEGLSVEYLPRNEDSKACFAPQRFMWSEFKSLTRRSDDYTFDFVDHRRHSLVVPADALPTVCWEEISSRFEEQCGD